MKNNSQTMDSQLAGRPCTLELKKHHVTVTSQKKIPPKQTNGFKKTVPPPPSSPQDDTNPHLTISYKAEKEYYQLVYLSKSDTRTYGSTISEGGEREDTPMTPDNPQNDPTTCTFPTGCYADSFAFCIFRNLTVIGVVVMLIQTGFISIQTLQSSIHAHSGYGVISISCTYIATIITCFLASAVMTSFSQRVILVIVSLASSVYFACNMVPEEHLYLLIPGSCVFGLAQGLMWVSMMAYVTRVAHMYARKHELDRYAVLGKFTGIVFGIASFAQVLAHVLSGVYFALLPENADDYGRLVSGSEMENTHGGVSTKRPINVNQTNSHINSRRRQHVYPSATNNKLVAASSVTSKPETMPPPKCGALYVNPHYIPSSQRDLHTNVTIDSISRDGGTIFKSSLTYQHDNPASYIISTSEDIDAGIRPVPYVPWLIFCSLCILLVLLAILVTLLLLKRLPQAECCHPSQVTYALFVNVLIVFRLMNSCLISELTYLSKTKIDRLLKLEDIIFGIALAQCSYKSHLDLFKETSVKTF